MKAVPLRGECLVVEAGLPAQMILCQQYFKALEKLSYSRILSCLSKKPRPPHIQGSPKQGEDPAVRGEK